MELFEQVEIARAGYLARVVGARESGAARHDAYAAEVFLALPKGGGLLGDCCRLDGAGASGESVTISDIHFDDRPLNISAKGFRGEAIRCQGFNWGGCRFRLLGGFWGRKTVPLPMDALQIWFHDWIGPRPPAHLIPHSSESLRAWVQEHPCAPADHEGREAHLGVIHGLSLVSEDEFTVDFGSAPLEAFKEILAVLAGAGASKIVIEAEANRQDVLYGRIVKLLKEGDAAAAAQFGASELAG